MEIITRSLVSTKARVPIQISVRMMSQGYVANMNENPPDVLFSTAGDDKSGYNGTIVLNRPKTLNALTTSMVNEIYPQLKSWESSINAVVIKAAGDKAFCAGGDVKSIALALDDPADDGFGLNFFRKEYRLNHLIGTYKKPYVALIHGIVMGGGVGLSVHGKYRVATESTVFAMPETAIGFCPDVGGTHFLSRLEGKLGVFLGLTGTRLRGSDVLHAGIATHYVPSNKLNDLSAALTMPGPRDISEILDEFHSSNRDSLNKEFSLAPHMKQINECFSAETVEGIVSRLKADGSEWSKNVLLLLSKMSPTALKVSKAAIEKGRDLSLADCLRMEYGICCASYTRHGDFYEGVRALLIDKDQKPVWTPKTLEEVSDEKVATFFAKVPSPDDLPL